MNFSGARFPRAAQSTPRHRDEVNEEDSPSDHISCEHAPYILMLPPLRVRGCALPRAWLRVHTAHDEKNMSIPEKGTRKLVASVGSNSLNRERMHSKPCARKCTPSNAKRRQHEEYRERVRAYMTDGESSSFLHHGGAAYFCAARGNRAPEKFIEPGQVAWQGRKESESCFFSSAGRIR